VPELFGNYGGSARGCMCSMSAGQRIAGSCLAIPTGSDGQ
jgi:hypothetical protein